MKLQVNSREFRDSNYVVGWLDGYYLKRHTGWETLRIPPRYGGRETLLDHGVPDLFVVFERNGLHGVMSVFVKKVVWFVTTSQSLETIHDTAKGVVDIPTGRPFCNGKAHVNVDAHFVRERSTPLECIRRCVAETQKAFSLKGVTPDGTPALLDRR